MPRTARLPPPAPASAPVVVGAERRPSQRGQPALDHPPLAAEPDPARPQRPAWPAASLAYAPSVNAEAVPSLRYVGLPVADTVTPQDDPTALVVRVERAELVYATVFAELIEAQPGRLRLDYGRDPWTNGRWDTLTVE